MTALLKCLLCALIYALDLHVYFYRVLLGKVGVNAF